MSLRLSKSILDFVYEGGGIAEPFELHVPIRGKLV